jgi:hypothetical protein
MFNMVNSIISSRNFGVELESHPSISLDEVVDIIKKKSDKKIIKTKWKQSVENDYWHVKTDSTCGGGYSKGWEIASFKASGHRDLLEICDVSKALSESGLRCGEDCGLHVHVDISDFTVEQASVLLAYWIKIEKIVLKTVPFFRSKNKYCRLIEKKISSKKYNWHPLDFWNCYCPKDLSIHNNKDKRVTMNLVNYVSFKHAPFVHFSRPTVEFRFPEGTFNQNDIKNWVILFINFVDNIKFRKMPVNLFCVSNVDSLIDILGIVDKNNKKWFFNRLFYYDSRKKWKKIAKNQIEINHI